MRRPSLRKASALLAWGIAAGSPLSAQVEPLPDTGSGITRDVGSIAIIEHDGSGYDKLLASGEPNVDARAAVALRFYQDHGDLYDFLAVFTNFEFETPGTLAFNLLVRNDVEGIGTPPINLGTRFGSPARLDSYLDMAAISRYRTLGSSSGPLSLTPGDPGFLSTLNVLAHELGHQWLVRINYIDGGGVSSGDLLGRDAGHWSTLLDSDASLMDGVDWLPLGGGSFRADRLDLRYSDLDLYLMGFLPPEEIVPFMLLRNPEFDPTKEPTEGDTITAATETVTIDQIVQAEGPRSPSHVFSPKIFRLGFIFLTAPGVEPDPDDLAAVDRVRQAFPAHFFTLTRGVAIADTTLAERSGVGFAPAPDLTKAVAWLESRQSIDGRWEDAPGTAVRDTSAVLRTLRAVGQSSQLGYQQGITWLLGQQPSNLDYRARRAVALAETTTPFLSADDLAAEVLASQNADGGLGVAAGYRSDALDTALALRALHALDRPADAQVRSALRSLPDLAEAPGLWSLVSGGEPSTIATAQVLVALLDWVDTAEAQDQIAAAAAGLSSRRNPDGGFGESPSTPYATALALQGLARSGAAAEVIDAATAWLELHQSLDGSWGGSTFATALVVDALLGGVAPNLIVPADDLVLDPAPVPEGDVVRVTAAIVNEGATAAPPSVARLFDGDPATTPGLADASVPALQPAERASVTFDYATSGKAGSQTLYVVADADAEVAESREFDNATSRSLRIDGPLPDLVLTPFDIVTAPAPAEAGENIEIAVTIRNLGEAAAPESLLRVLDGLPLAAGSSIGAAPVPPIGVGEAITVSVFWDTTGAEGSHTIVAIADADFAIDEGEAERNNEAVLDLEVTGPLPPGPDFAFGPLTVEPSFMSFVPQAATLRVVARNLGVDSAVAEVAVFDGDIGTPALATQRASIDGRSSTIVDFTFELPTPGSRSLIVIADPVDLIVETDETNNQARVAVTDPQNTFDIGFLPEEVGVSAASVIVGEPIDVTATVRNHGTAPVVDLPVVLGRRQTGGLTELTRTLVSLAPGASTTVALSWTTSFTGSPAELRVEADPFDLIAELDETNNGVDIDVDIAASARTNLAVGGADLSFAPDPPREGEAVTISAVVVNGSAVSAPGFAADFFLGDPDAGGVSLGQAAAAGLAAGAAVTLTIDWNPVDVRGAQGVFVVVDPQDQIAEYDETDNRAFRPFDVLGLADLVLTTADVMLDPAFPRAAEPVLVSATVRNLGAQTAAATSLQAWEGEPGSGALIGAVAVPKLAPGAAGSVELSWTPAVPYTFADHARYLDAFIEGLGLERITLVIHDWGSGLGFHWAKRHPDRVRGIAFMEAILQPSTWAGFPKEFRLPFRMMRTPGVGFLMISVANIFVKQILPQSIVRKLTAEEMEVYSAPYPTIASRRPVRQWPTQIPIDGHPAVMHEIVSAYNAWLQQTDVPKLLLYAQPGAILTPRLVRWCRDSLKNLKTVDLGEGLHYLQEDHPRAIGQHVARWYLDTVQAGG